MASDAEVRKREVLEATEDCVNKLESNLNADCSQLVADVHQGLKSTETLVTALRNDSLPSDTSSVSSESSSSSSSSSCSSSSSDSEAEGTPTRPRLGQKNSVTRRPEISPVFSNKENFPIPKERHSVKVKIFLITKNQKINTCHK